MKLSKRIFLISAGILFFFGLQAYSAICRELGNPMTEEEHQYFKKYVGTWKAAQWREIALFTKGRDVEIRIRKIEPEKRKALLFYRLGESAMGLPPSASAKQADCIGKRIYFSTAYNKFELVLEGEYLRGTRIGRITQEAFFKRIPRIPMREEDLKYFETMTGKWWADRWDSTGTKRYTNKGVQLTIGKIETDERCTSVNYFLGEGVTEKASEKTFPAECIERKIVFFTGKNDIELVPKDDQIWAERIGSNPARAVLKRME